MNWIIFIVVAITVFIGIMVIAQSTSAKYWIETGGTTYYTDEYKEENGCIEFLDTFEHKVKQCGFYSIREMK